MKHRDKHQERKGVKEIVGKCTTISTTKQITNNGGNL